MFSTWERMLAASLRDHGADQAQASQLATLIVASVEGTVAMCRARRDIRPLDDVTAQLEALVQHAIGGQAGAPASGPAHFGRRRGVRGRAVPRAWRADPDLPHAAGPMGRRGLRPVRRGARRRAPWAPDVNAPHASGVSPYPINSRAGRRVTVNDGYLEPARSLPGLTVRGQALVDRVVFSGDRAVGVQVIVDGRATTEYADEIVLSAGVIHSPAILMRSGVGPADHLRRLGITVRQDLPVGLGMQDHPMVVVELPLTADAAIKTADDRHTNVCVRFTSGPDGLPHDMMFVSLNQNVLSMEAADTRFPAGGFGVWLNQNHSRGVLTLTSADPQAQPEVRERMLSDARDLERLRQGVRALAEMARGPEVAPIVEGSVETRNSRLFAVLDDDAELDDHLLATAVDAQHGTSTCRMGAPGDASTVVDPSCRILGVDGLRVVDASIFPSVPLANTNLATIMVGELMADRL
ncbi:GMC oxidoreductase [Nonomuraea sp. NPDC049784]|uniref:GMC family oxidoreductase n=1 Tax=Nonomuraea sp. NPDC049784 TaxID=3154361 RepID=UPI0033CBC43E